MVYLVSTQRSQMMSVVLWALSHQRTRRTAIAALEIADHQREMPVAAELGDDLLVEPALVIVNRQDQVGPLLGGELINACPVSIWLKGAPQPDYRRTNAGEMCSASA